MFYHPITFKEAAESLGKRKQTPTVLKARELARQWSDDARAKAFFSARVASATILSELHRRAMQVVDGEMTQAQARNLIRRYFVGPGAKPLQNLGFAPKEDAMGVAQLASTARIELILETNVRMAQEVGHYQQWAEFRDTYKYGIWKCGYSKEHRVEHLARDGRAYAFDHPIWTQSPPGGEFNCHCYRVLATEEDLEEMGIEPEKRGSAFQRSSLGFDPSRGFRKPPEFGKRVLKEYRDIAKRQIEQYEGKQEDHLFDNGVATMDSKLPVRIKEAAKASLDAISEITGTEKQPFNSIHRLMTEREKNIYIRNGEPIPLGKHESINKDGRKYHEVIIRPDAPFPAFTDMHEMVHAYIGEGIIKKKEVDNIYQLVQHTRTYSENESRVRRVYAERRVNEWVTRAITWSWVARTTNPVVEKEKFAILKKEDYITYTVWKGFNKPKEAYLADIELEEAIMKLTPKTVLGKLRRKLGFSDSKPVVSKDDEIIIAGFTRKRLQELCDEEGITIEEFLTNMEENHKKWLAIDPNKRPIAIL